MNKILTSVIIVCSTVALVVPVHAENANNPSGNTECNTPIAGLFGAVAGGLLGKKNRLAGAAIGASVASLACMALNYQAAQTKTAQQVQDEYKTQNDGQLPKETVIARYESKIAPNEQVRPGSKTTLNSTIEVVRGTADIVPTIEEEVSLFDPNGKQITSTRKVANQNGDAGAFTTSFSFTLPEGVKQGVYPIKTALFLNGQQANTGEVALQVVMTQTGTIIGLVNP